MPCINRIRVNNVKYNFGTQQYDDFTMRLYGKNTLYDLANGGGKSILMLLLLQNLIPNCTLDEKQPIEKLFRPENSNTTIHSLIEWKLDNADIKDGYRYMTTGFCARKAPDTEGRTDENRETASIEYFNYCILYREYNRNDIINLPLSKGEEKMTFKGLKDYLKDLMHKDMGLEIKIFDRKGEYQRFISNFGLYDSHWEIIRGINKTEGHVRTYFETNYKTTRKVVEDLLIEEIIEKAFRNKTGREASEENMAETLLDIKDKLALLAKKKRDIAGYDHQIELINVLESKVSSCMGLYDEYRKVEEKLADLCVTSRAYAENDDRQLENLAEDRDRRLEEINRQKMRLAGLKITANYCEADRLRDEAELMASHIRENESRMSELETSINYKESVNDYISYKEDGRALLLAKQALELAKDKTASDGNRLAVYAYNRKMRDNIRIKELLLAKEETLEAKNHAEAETEYYDKLVKEGEIAQAVNAAAIADASCRMESYGAKLGELNENVSLLVFEDAGGICKEAAGKRDELEAEAKELKKRIEDIGEEMTSLRYDITISEAAIDNMTQQQTEYEYNAKEYRDAAKKLDNIKLVYNTDMLSDTAAVIEERINNTLAETIKRQELLEKINRQTEYLETGRMFGPSEGALKVIDYIGTRHGIIAMHGMDYMAALPADRRMELLTDNPELPYGVVVKNFEQISDDMNLKNLDTGNESIVIYDMDRLSRPAGATYDNAIISHKNIDYFTDEDIRGQLIKEASDEAERINEEIGLINEKLSTYREDLDFVNKLADSRYTKAEEKLRILNKDLLEKKDFLNSLRSRLTELEDEKDTDVRRLDELVSRTEQLSFNMNIYYQIDGINKELLLTEKKKKEYEDRQRTLDKSLDEYKSSRLKWSTTVRDETNKLLTIANGIDSIQKRWDEYYEDYYVESASYEILTDDDEVMDADFMALRAASLNEAPDISDKKKLVETFQASRKRIENAIRKRGFELSDFENDNLYITDEETLKTLGDEYAALKLKVTSENAELAEKTKALSRLEGSIEYALSDMEKTYGKGSYVREEAAAPDLKSAIQNGDMVLSDMEKKLGESVERYNAYYKEQGYMLDLYKDISRIIHINGIDISKGEKLSDDKESLRRIFEESLMEYDRKSKKLDKAKNELLKFKGQTAEALGMMEVYELADTIRNDVTVPDNYYDAKALLDSLLQIVEYIRLEKERVEKGIEDMAAIKESFEDQCIQRCMDVKTELEKLPKLSKITMGDEVIKMVELSIPYVKEEFVKPHMSVYIDDIVKGADAFEDDKKRLKYIRECLGLKKLFGVMVTDMNAIKLKLYKRERIKEQSRYLRYEEAVGSTGQSQGIYIQFLVAVINYIAGIYSYNTDGEIPTKTIFIDNPFGAAKDIYIWEPIFAMLAENNVQLIVPARGATPAITGRFDVNYVLGQKLTGGRQQTVVVEYTSKTSQEEVEYHELSYEQATFDFI